MERRHERKHVSNIANFGCRVDAGVEDVWVVNELYGKLALGCDVREKAVFAQPGRAAF
jgi:hypothetical protein